MNARRKLDRADGARRARLRLDADVGAAVDLQEEEPVFLRHRSRRNPCDQCTRQH